MRLNPIPPYSILIVVLGMGCSPQPSAERTVNEPTKPVVSIETVPEIFHLSDLLTSQLAQEGEEEGKFLVHWPPADPTGHLYQSRVPLLDGQINFCAGNLVSNRQAILLNVVVRRRTDEASRLAWNQQLEFPQHSWMSRVRFWDGDEKWLWPNLPFLLRAHGQARVERYGGIDPGQHIDNDFAAILIRCYDAQGVETVATQKAPLVSAEWLPAPPDCSTNVTSIVHSARSETFFIPLTKEKIQKGRIDVWLIYADFLESRVPRRWPKEPEFNGGILTFTLASWVLSNGLMTIDAKSAIPKSSTGFDWQRWFEDASAEPRLILE